MGPIPGISWSDIGVVAGGLVLASTLIWLQWSVAGTLPAGRPRSIGRAVLIALVIPFLVVSLQRDRVMPSEALRLATMFLWIAGMVLVRLASTRRPAGGPLPGGGVGRARSVALTASPVGGPCRPQTGR